MGEEAGSHYLNTGFTGNTSAAFLSGGDIFHFIGTDLGTAKTLGDGEL
tara:strand:+ start:1950 stop:2093 length:144 start_codon:yes stop_codon:yes gene_type:complete